MKTKKQAKHKQQSNLHNRHNAKNTAWVATAYIDANGNEAKPDDKNSLPIFAVNVHVGYLTDIDERLHLLEKVACCLKDKIPEGRESLWVFPGGFFGLDASDRKNPYTLDYDERKLQEIKDGLREIVSQYPPKATIAIGVDIDDKNQQIWFVRLNKDIIQRGETDLPNRIFTIGQVKAAFFVCGEFTGSRSNINGPYYKKCYLDDVENQLGDCRLLVDLAHHRVRHTITGRALERKHRPPVHQQQLERFSCHGAGMLTHHHEGKRTGKDNHQNTDCWNNWILFKGGKWLDENAVTTIQL